MNVESYCGYVKVFFELKEFKGYLSSPLERNFILTLYKASHDLIPFQDNGLKSLISKV